MYIEDTARNAEVTKEDKGGCRASSAAALCLTSCSLTPRMGIGHRTTRSL